MGKESNKTVKIGADEETMFAHIAAGQDARISKLIDWSETNSGSTNRPGLAAMRAKLIIALSDLPASVEEVALAPSMQIDGLGNETQTDYEPAVLASVRPDAPVQVVFTGHYDTVFPAHSYFQATKRLGDDKLGGPGTADMKGGILVMLAALGAFEMHPSAANIGYKILLSPDEETGSHGSAPLLAKLGRAADIGMTYEPALADGSLAGARKGSGNFTFTVRGKAAHAGREHHIGRNAIAAMARFVTGLDNLNGHRDGVTFNIAKIDGGGPYNVVPDLAIGRFNVRALDESGALWVQEEIAKLAATTSREDGISVHLHGKFTRPPKPMAPANARVFDWVKRAGAALDIDIRWSASGGVCEGNNLWASGCPNVDTLGVIGGHIHSDKEYMQISSLTSRACLSALILANIAGGTFDAKTVKSMAMQHLEGVS